ncbi:MAG TPA: hypothetical protein VKF36_19425 [Syntrophorhabdales bacterium]|nr:hypothetical protein [Syntrophorhabdales bacterium]
MKMFTVGILAGLMALAFLANPDLGRAQNYRTCAWPIELSPEGSGNMLGPDTLSRYWVMPFDTTQYQTMTIKGAYPDARYFSFVAYDTNADKMPVAPPAGALPLALYDAQIAPDPGSVNPFVHPATGVNGTYTVKISHNGQTSGNTIGVSSDFAWVLLRVYVPRPDPSLSGQSLIGGVPLPTILVNGEKLPPCPSVTDNDQAPGINKLADVIKFLQIFFPQDPTPFDLIGHEGTPSSDRLWFAAPTDPPPALLPNPHNKYIAMLPGDSYQPGRIIVIHGKLPGTPDTYNGSPIWVPARGFRTVDMRYWSLCINDFALPVPVVNCTADLTTDLQGGDYTIVISDDQLRPDWLRPDINWLPWGDAQYLKIVFARNMLPAPNFPFSIQKAIEKKGCTFPFDLPYIPARDVIDTAGQCAQHVMGDYYPVAAWCDKSTFVHGGWQACMKQR